MTEGEFSMNGYQQAALCLYELNESDQKWMLGQLPQEQRGHLEKMLGELHEMKIPKDSSFLGLLAPSDLNANVGLVGQDGVGNAQLISYINCASVELVYAVLSVEPDYIIAAILKLHRWSWGDAIFRMLPAERRNVFQHGNMLTYPRISDLVGKTLLEIFAARLRERENTVFDLPPNEFSFWERGLRLLRRMWN